MVNPKIEKFIFGQLINKLAITHTIAIKLKEKLTSMVVECQHLVKILKKNPNLQKKKKNIYFFEDWDFFQNLGKSHLNLIWKGAGFMRTPTKISFLFVNLGDMIYSHCIT